MNRSVKVEGDNHAPIVTGDNNILTLTPPNTEQILDYNSFIKTYNTSKFSTPLDIGLQFREKEKQEFEESIDSSPIVMITGNAGVGKTKFALEVCNKIAIDNGYTFKAILGRGVELFSDIKTIFGQDDSFIVLIDDANRVGMALNYILEYFPEKVQNGTIKIVLTVRDYAKEKIFEKIPFEIKSREIEIKQLEDKEITEIVKDSFAISNPHFLERIANISKGNPRLAIMASIVAKETNSLSSLYDVSNLYDKYFSTIQQDIDDFKDSELLLSISIISFFRVIDRENEQQMKIIEEAFSLSIEDFWKNVDTLHDLEVVDLYENSVVKISDQILSMYLFYRAVFVDKKVDINIFLEHFFLLYQNRFIDMLTPLIDTFHFQTIFDVLKEPVDSLWKEYEIDEDNLILIMKTFWFLKEEEILLFCSKKINALEEEKIDIEAMDFWVDIKGSQSDKLLEILSLFTYSKNITMAIELVVSYLQKRPSKVLKVINLFTKEFAYTYHSHRNNYKREDILLDILWQSTKNGEDEILSKLFIRSSSCFLKFEFEENQSNRKTITIQHYRLLEIDVIKRQRDTIFENIFSLFSNEIYQKNILRLLNQYPELLGYHGVSKIEEWDKINILNFIDNHLDPQIYEHSLVVENILKTYDRCGIEYEIEIKNKFVHHSCEVKNMLMLDDGEISLENKKDNVSINWDEIYRIKKERLSNLIDGYSIDNWIGLFDESITIYSSVIGREDYKLKNNFPILFTILVERDRALYIDVFMYYLELGNPFSLVLDIRSLINILGKEEAYSLLNKYEYNDKNQYLFRFFIALKTDEIGMDDVEKLICLYKESEIKDMAHHLDYIEKYLDIQDSLLIDIVSIVLYKSKSDDKYITHLLSGLFDYTNISKKTEIYFEDNIELLKEVYLVTNKQQQHFDYTKVGLNKILNMDKSFLKDYLDSYFEKEKYISIHNISGEYTILWERDEYEELFISLIDNMFEIKNTYKIYDSGEVIKAFFTNDRNNDRANIDDKASELLKKYIVLTSDSEEKIVFIFKLIAEFTYEIVSEMVEFFVDRNSSFEIFKQLQFTPTFQSWSGSRIPSLQKEMDFYNTISYFMNGIDLLEHKAYIKNHISLIEQEIRGEMKRDFMDD